MQRTDTATGPSARSRWLRQLLQWHWISSAISLAGLLGFAITGVTLNHASSIEAGPSLERHSLQLDPAAHALLAGHAGQPGTPLPPEVTAQLIERLGWAGLAQALPEWSPDEVYLALPGPGTDAWLRIDRHSGELEAERSDRGWVAYFNDLHKGRHTGLVWSAFIDLLGVACCVFALTGLLILRMHARHRPLTWPLVGLGLALPALLGLLWLH
jgi:hypothetical protein